MGRQEILNTRMGEFLDLTACLAIYNGGAEEKKKKMSFDEVMALQ